MPSVEHLSFGYRDKLVGSDVNLSVVPGQVLALMGENGAGKTTLFKTILGLIKPLAGNMSISGRDLATYSRGELAREVAFVPQAHAALFPYRVIDIILMARASLIGVFATPSSKDFEIAEEALSALGIHRLRDRLYTEISGGERQIVLIARALAQQSNYLILDEPTASLDYGHQLQVLAHIRGLGKRGIGVILSAHNPDHVFLVADEVALMHQGQILATGAPQDVVTLERLKLLYDVDVVIGVVPGGQQFSCSPLRQQSNFIT